MDLIGLGGLWHERSRSPSGNGVGIDVLLELIEACEGDTAKRLCLVWGANHSNLAALMNDAQSDHQSMATG